MSASTLQIANNATGNTVLSVKVTLTLDSGEVQLLSEYGDLDPQVAVSLLSIDLGADSHEFEWPRDQVASLVASVSSVADESRGRTARSLRSLAERLSSFL